MACLCSYLIVRKLFLAAHPSEEEVKSRTNCDIEGASVAAPSVANVEVFDPEIMDRIAADYCFSYKQMQADIDEQALGDRSRNPQELVSLLARAKADALKARLSQTSGILITCDQVVVCNDKILEKPTDVDEVS